MIQLACTHCRHQFELERKEGALCPSCGWSSSVILASELESQTSKTAQIKSSTPSFSWVSGFFIFALKFLAFAAVITLFIFGIVKFLGSHRSPKTQSKEIKVAQTSSDSKSSQSLPTPAVLSADEQVSLNSSLQIPVEPQLTDEDQNLLQKSMDLTAGNVEKLPSVNWTAEQFKQYLEAQEKQYRMPLPRNYKKSIQELFQKNYAIAYDLFLEGKIQRARDAYVASLGLPIYENNVRKHRAVVLTMLRNFLNDTIAKIGAMNFALARQSVSGKDAEIGTAYAALQQQIRARQWNDARESIKKIEAILPESAVSDVLQAPPYTKGFEMVDADIQPVLFRLLQVPAWTFNLSELKSDLEVKKTLLAQLSDPDRKSSLESYGKAMVEIQARAWNKALPFLQAVKSPAELKQDAETKVSLIGRLSGSTQLKDS